MTTVFLTAAVTSLCWAAVLVLFLRSSERERLNLLDQTMHWASQAAHAPQLKLLSVRQEERQRQEEPPEVEPDESHLVGTIS